MYWQRQIEQAAFRAGGCNYRAPAQLVGDFLKKQPSQALGAVQPAYRPGVTLCELHEILPERITSVLGTGAAGVGQAPARLRPARRRPDRAGDAQLVPVRILRDETRQSSLRGLYPCGEGAGYAGGITSAALDGILTAEAIINELSNLKAMKHMAQIIPFPADAEEPELEALSREALLALAQELREKLAELDAREPEDMMSKAYERWGERHEALEDELDDLLDLLDGQ